VRVPPQSAAGVQSGSSHTLDGASRGEVHEPAEAGHGATRGRATAVPPVPHGGNGNGNGQRVFATPLARRVAADKGIDLSQIQGTGPQGRIVQRDVLTFAERPPAAPGRPAAPGAAPLPQRIARGQTEAVPLNKMRQAIAAALQRSKQQVPHFYVTVDVDVEAITALRAGMNKALEPEGIKLSLNDFVSKAAATALLRHPAVNAHFTGDSIVRFGDVHLGIAVAIPDGLIVPVLRSADQMDLRELQQRTAELAKKARATPPRLKEDEMKGATFTISNLGMYGVRDFAAIINPPSVAILAVAGAEKRAVVRGDQVVARTMMSLTLSVDHRAVDGATAAEFLRTLKGLLEEPGMMLV
jgi:pyruvate dehydrogenase E2 component (dihydrolipoamide acetyltransferase)